MIPRVTVGGGSFKGAFLYYMRDKGGNTRERVAWTRVENMITDCPDKAWRVMAYTAQAQDRLKEASGQLRTGRKLEKPVFSFSLSWHPEQSPSADHMLDTARRAIGMLGLGGHQAVIIAHVDEPQPHVHVIVNRVHPLTGLAGDIRNSKRKFSDFAREYERASGKIYCPRREENYRKRTMMKQTTRYSDPHLQEAWDAADSGRAFVAALEEKGYRLAQGRKRLVVVDPYGKTHNPTRLLKDVRAAAFRERLADVDLSDLPDADELAAQRARHADKPPSGRDEKPRDAPPASVEKKRDVSAFRRLARAQIMDMKRRHRDERRKLADDRARHIKETKARLVSYYDLHRRKRDLAALRAKIEGAPLWRRFFGVTKKDRERFNENLAAYREAVNGYRQGVAGAEDRRTQAFAEQEQAQLRERGRLAFTIKVLRAQERGRETGRGIEDRSPWRADRERGR